MTDKEKKKPRMTCKKYCPVWNDIDKDCEIYGEHHFTPRTCPHYNIEILEKMKMAEMYNKIIEENYVAKTENVAKNVANENSQDLTEQWKRGEFIICNAGKCQYYYVRNEEQQEVIKTEYCLFDDNTPNWQILAPVPSYEEWQAKLEQNAQLKELLKECKPYIALYTESNKHIGFTPEIANLLQRINEVLK